MAELRMLVGGQAAFSQIQKRIEQAQKTIEINMFIWRDDYIGNQMIDILYAAAQRGVKVTISKDALGGIFELSEEHRQSMFHKDFRLRQYVQGLFLDKMYPMNGKSPNQKQQKNVKLDGFLAHSNISISYKKNKKDHSKYYIFDDQIVIVGGINIEDKELFTDVEGRPYHDYMVACEGKNYVDDFRMAIKGQKQFAIGDSIGFMINRHDENGTGHSDFHAKSALLKLLEQATISVDVVMAYLGDPDIENRLIELVQQGIRVRMIMPVKANLQQDLNVKALKRMYIKTQGQIRIYFSPYMVHAKLVKIDEKYVTLGSLNLNRQAMEKLAELNIIVSLEKNEFKNVLDQSISDQLNQCKEVKSINDFKFNKMKAFCESLVC